MKTEDVNSTTDQFISTERMPVFFLGHGSPMNAIQENEFSKSWQEIGKTIPNPRAILCVSAHWETRGTWVSSIDKPTTIHDFGGFPEELYEVEYPAPGSPDLASEIKNKISKINIGLDYNRGLDHGAWSVIKHIFPNADTPVVQLSLDYSQPPQYHYELGKELYSLRNEAVLIIGSGNLVHNLPKVDWNNFYKGFDWAIKANTKLKELISGNEHQELINYKELGEEMQWSIPTPEHYLPLLYVLALKDEDETISFFNDSLCMGSLSMLSLKIG